MRFVRLLPLLVASLFFVTTLPASADDTSCPAGTVAITAQTRADATAAGIPTSSNCWTPKDANTGDVVAKAKEFLRGILCSPDADNYGGEGPDGTIQGLDAKFAECSANFLKSVQQSGISICIREGKRSVAKQDQYAARYRAGGSIACTKGAGCEHPRGIAIDVNTNSMANYDRIHQMAPNFGLIFYLPVKDKVHFVPMKGGCSAGGTAPSAGILPPTYYDFPQDYVAPTIPNSSLPYSPTAPMMTGFSSGLSMTPQATPAAAPTTVTSPTTPAQNICNPGFTCSGNVQYYQTSSCSSTVYQVCQNGCSGNVCSAASSTPSIINNSFGTSSTSTDSSSNTNTNTNSNSITQNVSDILSSLVPSFSAVSVGTSTGVSFALNPDTGDVVQLDAAGHPLSTSSTGSGSIGTISSVQPMTAPQTFTSSDLGSTGTFTPPRSQNALASILSGMRSALEWALSVLKPFGGTPNRTY